MTRNSASKPFYFHIEVYLGETGYSREGKNDDMKYVIVWMVKSDLSMTGGWIG